jgi:YVTN family beta-propeller protein
LPQPRRLLCSLSLAFACAAAPAQVLLVVNQRDSNVSFVDPASGRQLATLPEHTPGVHAHEVAVSPDGRTAFLPIYGSTGVGKPGIDGRTLLIVDIPSRKIVGAIDFGHPVRPHLPVLDPARHLLYVTTELDHSVTIIDPRTRKILGAVPTGQPQSHMLALSHDGRFGYTANVGPGSVSVLDLLARKTIAVIPVAPEVQRIAISPDDKMVFTADQTRPQLAVIDTASRRIANWIPLPALAYGTAPTPDGRWLLVTLPSANQVAVVDLATLRVVRRINVPADPQEILIRPDAKVAYVSCAAGNQVAAIDLTRWTVPLRIPVGAFPDGLAWAK